MPSKPAPRKKHGVAYDTVRALALSLPGVAEGTSYGTSALKVAGKLFIRLKEDGETIVLRTDFLEREHLTRTAPKTFFVTDHYRDHPWVLVRLTAITRAQLAPLVEDAWRRTAPKRLLATHNSARATKR